MRTSQWQPADDFSGLWEKAKTEAKVEIVAIKRKDSAVKQSTKHLASMGIKDSVRNELKKTYPEQMQSLEEAVEKFVENNNSRNIGNINYALAALNEVVRKNRHNYNFKRFTPNL